MVYNLYPRFNPQYFPWLFPEDNEWQLEGTFNTLQGCLDYLSTATKALEYKLEEV
jgi:hypothetical protein